MVPNHASSGGRPLILDGGTGSELRRRGVTLSDRCWSAAANLDHRDVLTAIHTDYIEAGADIITANTFATTRFVLADAGLDARFEEINRSAIEAAKEAATAAGRPISVAASMSCFPPGFDPRRYPPADAEYRAYAEIAACFVEHGADLILLEMLQNPQHASLACRAASASGLPFWAGVSCRYDSRSRRLVAFDDAGRPFSDVLESVMRFDPCGIAIMHSPVDAVGPALEQLETLWTGPVGAWAEIGYPEDPDARHERQIPAKRYSEAASAWLALGASLLGGCCGTTPAHVAALRELVEDHS